MKAVWQLVTVEAMGFKIPLMLPLYSWLNNGHFLNYTDRELGAKWAAGGYNLGTYYTNPKDSEYMIAARNIGKSTGSLFIQETF